MKRSWISLAFLSASWLFGLSYYHDAQIFVWAIFIAAGTGFLLGNEIRRPNAFDSALCAIMLIPVMYAMAKKMSKEVS